MSATTATGEALALRGAEVEYVPGFLSAGEADRLLARIREEVVFEQHRVRLFGREHPCPRLSAWHGDPHAVYRYSGQTLSPAPWTPTLAALRARVAAHCGEAFDAVLLNWYRDGRDGMGWHSDDEPELGPAPTLASVSLGGARRFVMKARGSGASSPARHAWVLEHGSLFVMRGPTQHNWRHAVPKTRRGVAPRLNLTFRRVVGPGGTRHAAAPRLAKSRR